MTLSVFFLVQQSEKCEGNRVDGIGRMALQGSFCGTSVHDKRMNE